MIVVTVLRWFTLVSLLVWMIVYWRGGQDVVEDIQQAAQAKNSRLDTALMIAIAICSLVMAATGLGLSLAQAPGAWIVVLIGSACTVLGIIGMFYSRHYLGRFWTAETTVRVDHKVIDTGPYGVVRHPIYTFAILMYLGLGLAFMTWWTAVAAGIIVIAYALKARDEDKFLERNLDGYAEYRQRVRAALVPGVW